MKTQQYFKSGDNISEGTANLGYIPPFVFSFSPSKGLTDDPNFAHRYAFLVFKQQGKIDLPAESEICNKDVGKRDQVSSNAS